MSVIGNILRSTPINWLHKFIYLLKLDNYACNPFKQNVDLCGTATNDLLLQLISSSKWSWGTNIELVEDILGWINDNLEELKDNGTIEVNAIKGEALNEFIKDNQQEGKYQEISNAVLNSLLNSVVIVALDENGDITEDQMIRSKEGLSPQLLIQFNGQPILKIKIPK